MKQTLITRKDPIQVEARRARCLPGRRSKAGVLTLLKNRLMGTLLPIMGKSSLSQRRVLVEFLTWGIAFLIFLVTPFPAWLGNQLVSLGGSRWSIPALLGATSLSLLLIAVWAARCWHELGKKTLLAETDALTGLFNRRHLRGLLAMEISRVKRHPRPLSLIMFDIDDFKKINDNFGHAEGDKVLKIFSKLVRETLRDQDCIARWGGDEFVIITPETDLLNSFQVAERLRYLFCKHDFGEVGQVTASFGVSRVDYQDDVDSFLNRVDRLLYLAKERGKNVVQTDPINLVARAAISRRSQLLA